VKQEHSEPKTVTQFTDRYTHMTIRASNLALWEPLSVNHHHTRTQSAASYVYNSVPTMFIMSTLLLSTQCVHECNERTCDHKRGKWKEYPLDKNKLPRHR